MLYQSGALWSSMTLAENVALPLERVHRRSTPAEIRELACAQARAGRARGLRGLLSVARSAAACRSAPASPAPWRSIPEILFFDEPSAGLDPISSRLLDDLILELRDSLGATVVVVTHELASIFAIGNNSVFLDAATKTMLADRAPQNLAGGNDEPHGPASSSPGADRQRSDAWLVNRIRP